MDDGLSEQDIGITSRRLECALGGGVWRYLCGMLGFLVEKTSTSMVSKIDRIDLVLRIGVSQTSKFDGSASR